MPEDRGFAARTWAIETSPNSYILDHLKVIWFLRFLARWSHEYSYIWDKYVREQDKSTEKDLNLNSLYTQTVGLCVDAYMFIQTIVSYVLLQTFGDFAINSD